MHKVDNEMKAQDGKRKPVTGLTLADLNEFPIWKYLDAEERLGAEDETWVTPLSETNLPKGVHSRIVATVFCTFSGLPLEGFMLVSTVGGKVEIDPGAIVGDAYFVLPTVSREIAIKEEYPWSIRDREKLTIGIKRSENQIFPLTYRLKVFVGKEREYRQGLLE